MTRHSRTMSVTIAALLLAAVTISAHMKLVKSLPADGASVTAAPSELRVWFSEAPDAKISKLTLQGPKGAVTTGAVEVAAEQSLRATVAGPLADGAYTASWQSAGPDGHVQKGTFSFTVRQTAAASSR